MNERLMQFRVGLLVLVTILVATILFFIFRGPVPLFKSTYTVYVKFHEAPGVTADTPIRKSGIRIGQVRSVHFGDQDDGVVVTAEIDKDRRIYRDEQCQVISSLLLGDTSLEFVRPAGGQRDQTPLENNAVIPGQMGPDMTGTIAGLQKQAVRTLDTLDKAGQDMHTLLTRLDHLVAGNEDKFGRLIDETEETMKLLQKTLIASNDIVGDPRLREQIKQTISEMPEILRETKSTVERMSGTFASMQQNMQNIEGLTKPLGERGESLVTDASQSMHKLNLLADNLLAFSRQIGDTDGTVGALLHDKELYQNVTHLVKNLDDMSRELKPILYNVEVFTDKIARHPGDLGVRGALKKDSGLKELPADDNGQSQQSQARRWPIGSSGTWSVGQGK